VSCLSVLKIGYPGVNWVIFFKSEKLMKQEISGMTEHLKDEKPLGIEYQAGNSLELVCKATSNSTERKIRVGIR
jgi:hypothetical protein